MLFSGVFFGTILGWGQPRPPSGPTPPRSYGSAGPSARPRRGGGGWLGARNVARRGVGSSWARGTSLVMRKEETLMKVIWARGVRLGWGWVQPQPRHLTPSGYPAQHPRHPRPPPRHPTPWCVLATAGQGSEQRRRCP